MKRSALRLATVFSVFVCISALAWTASLPKAQADGPTCGEKGQPSCPMQGWMETNMDGAVDKADLKALATAYEKLAGFSPDPKWNEGENSWSAISKAGAAAAKKGDLAEAKAQCKTCHKAWRKQYKATYLLKPVPK